MDYLQINQFKALPKTPNFDMGWLSQATKGPLESPDGAFEAPDRNSRTRCWEARDNYFKCLDRFDILDGIRNHDMATKHCGTESKDLERNCASSWVGFGVPEVA